MFTSYFLQSLKQGEEPVAIIHKHWVRLAPAILRALAAFIIPSFFIKYILSSKTATLVYLVFVVVLFLYILYSWVVFYFDVFIITDQRVIDIQQTGIFRRSVSEAPMSRIQDVTYHVTGFFATLFNYGRVTVRTASNSELQMDDIADPEEIQEMIVELQKLNQGDKKMSAEELVEYISGVRTEKNLKNVDDEDEGDIEDDQEEDENDDDELGDDEGDEE